MSRTSGPLVRPTAAIAVALSDELKQASPVEIISRARQWAPAGRLAVVCSFGTESAVLLKFVADVDRSLPVLFLDTGWLFKETLAYRDRLTAYFGLTDVRTLIPSASALTMKDPRGDLCLCDHDACCAIRKVAPLAAELASFEGWINGRKRFQGGERAELAAVETDGRWLKFNPLARLSRDEVEAVFEGERLPRHPLEALGFASVGCVPCTSRAIGATGRNGRWSGLGKTECGIHTRGLVTNSPL
ncbi:MAG TPA: phosphoadenylyl-sulfate reductase [Xanthobacteraceae bacterium]|jgi:phosphoadenosine phosphosulfate reductase